MSTVQHKIRTVFIYRSQIKAHENITFNLVITLLYMLTVQLSSLY